MKYLTWDNTTYSTGIKSIERRFEQLEDKVLWLEKKLVQLGQIVEKDITQRLEEQEEEEEEEEEEDNGNSNSSNSRNSNVNHSGGSSKRRQQSRTTDTGGGWYISYDSIRNLFR
jgi:hypothetical protein